MVRKIVFTLLACLSLNAHAGIEGDGTNYLAGSSESFSWATSSGDVSIACWFYFENASTTATFRYAFAMLTSSSGDLLAFSWDNTTAGDQFAWIGKDTGGYNAYQYSSGS